MSVWQGDDGTNTNVNEARSTFSDIVREKSRLIAFSGSMRA